MKIKIFVEIIFLIILVCNPIQSFSQVKGLQGLESEILQNDLGNQSTDLPIKVDAMPIGNSIDPKYYYVGSGDIINLSISPILPKSVSIPVSPELTILLPRGGILDVKGMTLKNLNDTLEKMFLSKNPNCNVNVTLKESRKCLVSIRGNVYFPSTYTLPSSYKVSTSILFANQLQKSSNVPVLQMEALLQVQEKQRETERLFSESGIAYSTSYWSRNVILLHNDGTSSNCDLEKATALNDISLDPYVKEGDQIIVPFEKDNYPKISISGAVNRPAIIPFKKGDKASLLLKMGYGLSDKADFSNISLFLSQSGTKVQLQVDSTGLVLNQDYELEPGSSIIVGLLTEETIDKTGVISIKGNVTRPGNYLIQTGKSRLKEIIENAGGFTEKAYLPLAYIIRRENNQKSIVDPRRETYEVLQFSDLTMNDTVRYFIDMKYKQPLVSVDFVECFEKNKANENVTLQDGDVIVVPSNPGKVYVFGQVNTPGYVEYVEGRNMKWYIERAGGAAEGSEPERARIIRGKSYVWIEGKEDVFVKSGDMIYIPRVPDEPTYLKLQRYSVWAAVISTGFGILNMLYNIYLTSKNK